MTKLIFFAHGTTLDNELGNATGWLPGKLSGRGIQQSKALGEHLLKEEFSVIFCSDLTRAINTTILAVGNDIPIRVDWRLREINYGDMNGKPHAFKDTMEDFISQPFPSGESYEDTEKRISSFLDDMKEFFPNETVAIVGHNATQLAIDVIVKKISWKQAITEDWRKQKAWQPGWEYNL